MRNMDTILEFLVLVAISNKLVNGISIGSYVKTQTIIEKPNCRYDDVFNEKLKTFADVSMIACGILCTSHPKCKRFMYNKQSGICSLFQAGENCIDVNGEALYSFCYRQKSVCTETICTRCPMGYYGDECENVIKDCSDGFRKGVVPQINSLSYIQPAGTPQILEVKCSFQYNGWTYVQFRTSECSDIDYNRTWNDYSVGFGDASGNYWLGLKHIYNIVQNNPSSLLMVYVEGETSWNLCYYNNFRIHDETDKYKITTGSFVQSQTIDNGLSDVFNLGGYDINNQPFSTMDNDASGGCATNRQAGWWYLPHPTCARVKFNEDEIQWIDLNNIIQNFRKLHLRLQGQ